MENNNDNSSNNNPILQSNVELLISHSVLQTNNLTKYFPLDMTITQLKEKLYLTLGTEPRYMELEFVDTESGQTKYIFENEMENNENNNMMDLTLRDLNIPSGMRLFVKDTDPEDKIAQLLDTSAKEKYEMSREEYEKREGTVYALKSRQRQERAKNAAPATKYDTEPQNLYIGARCNILDKNKKVMGSAQIRYIGLVPESNLSGYFVGVEFERPGLGKGDGSVNGNYYFTCDSGNSLYVRSDRVVIINDHENRSSENVEDPDEI